MNAEELRAKDVKRGQRTPHPYMHDFRYDHRCRCGLVYQNPIHDPEAQLDPNPVNEKSGTPE